MQVLDELKELILENLTRNGSHQEKEILDEFERNKEELEELLESFKDYDALLETIKLNIVYFVGGKIKCRIGKIKCRKNASF